MKRLSNDKSKEAWLMLCLLRHIHVIIKVILTREPYYLLCLYTKRNRSYSRWGTDGFLWSRIYRIYFPFIHKEWNRTQWNHCVDCKQTIVPEIIIRRRIDENWSVSNWIPFTNITQTFQRLPNSCWTFTLDNKKQFWFMIFYGRFQNINRKIVPRSQWRVNQYSIGT